MVLNKLRNLVPPGEFPVEWVTLSDVDVDSPASLVSCWYCWEGGSPWPDMMLGEDGDPRVPSSAKLCRESACAGAIESSEATVRVVWMLAAIPLDYLEPREMSRQKRSD